MLPGYPSYRLLIYLFAVVLVAVLLRPRQSVVLTFPGFLMVWLYGENGAVAALMVTFLLAFFTAFVGAIEDNR